MAIAVETLTVGVLDELGTSEDVETAVVRVKVMVGIGGGSVEAWEMAGDVATPEVVPIKTVVAPVVETGEDVPGKQCEESQH